MRVHILGASGTGTTTLGRALATRRGVPNLDTDDYFWEPTDPPYVRPRPPDERRALLGRALDASGSWVLSGSLCGWGDPFVPRFDLAVFLLVPTEVRIERLRRRERDAFGAEALAPGGAMHRNHQEFIEWASAYDTGGLDMRSLSRHERWLGELPCPVLRLSGEAPTEVWLERVIARLSAPAVRDTLAGAEGALMQLRIAGVADAGTVARLVEGFRDHLGASRPTREQLDADLPQILADPDTEFALACAEDGEAVGYAQTRFYRSVWSSPCEAHLEDLYVVPEDRRRGFGRALLGFALERARGRGAVRIGLHTNENNTEGQALYRSFEFAPQTEARWDGGREVYWARRIDAEPS